MKFLHTADWHLGKRLDHISRFEEQKEVLEEICEIAEQEQVDMVLIAGDLFDHVNPTIESIELFYRILKRLAADGKRAVIGIAGNHDSPDRIEAPVPLAQECGIILTGYPDSKIRPFELETGLKVLRSDNGFLELQLPNIAYPIRLILTPYANEVRLKRYLGADQPEAELRRILETHWKKLADSYCTPEGVNLLMTHLFVMNKGTTPPVEPDDEKPIITVGGAQEVFTSNFPSTIQYVALGHLHRHQIVSDSPIPIVYSSSPLSYSMSEAGQQKYVNIVEVEPEKEASYSKRALSAGKTLERKRFENINAAVDWLQSNQNSLVELTIVSDQYLTATDRKLLYDAHSGIVSLIPQISVEDTSTSHVADVDLSKDIQELFVDYFQHKYGQQPNEGMLGILKEVLSEQES